MNSASAFAFACSGSLNENQIASYAQYVEADFNRLKDLGGWIGEQAKSTMAKFTDFVSSRAWELSKRLSGRNYGEYVGRFEVGYLGSLEAQQQAVGFMRNYIMANPLVMQLYQDEVISGYGGDFAAACTGIGNENLYYRKAMNGVVNLHEVDDVMKLERTHYFDGNSSMLPVRDIIEIQRTWKATNHHMAKNLFDCTSESNGRMSTAPEEDE